MKTKLDMAVKPVRYAVKPEHLVGWYKVREKEHWVVVSPNTGVAVGEIFRVKTPDKWYALVYDREYPGRSGCVESRTLRGLVVFMTGVAVNGAT